MNNFGDQLSYVVGLVCWAVGKIPLWWYVAGALYILSGIWIIYECKRAVKIIEGKPPTDDHSSEGEKKWT